MIATKPNEDGVVFVYGKKHKYLVTYQCDDDVWSKIETGRQIFDTMDMSDCSGVSIVGYVILMDDEEKPTACIFRDTWHDLKDKLKMQIENAVTGEVYDVGYGTDH